MTKNIKAQIMTSIEVRLPPKDISDINKENFWTYLWWPGQARNLDRVTNQFKEGAFDTTPFTDENRPAEKTKTALKISDDIEFIIETTPKTKTPPYKGIYLDTGDYLKFMNDEYIRGSKPKGILTIEDEPYISALDIFSRIFEKVTEVTSKYEGISQSLKLVKPKTLGEAPNKMTIVYDRDYSNMSEDNAKTYLKALAMKKEGDEITGKGFKTKDEKGEEEFVKGFKDILLYESLSVAGIKEEDVEKIYSILYPFYDSEVSFIHQIEPRESTSFGTVINSLIKQPNSKKPNANIKANMNIGDLPKIAIISLDGKDALMEKGLIDEKFIQDYSPKIRNGIPYIRLNGLIDRLNDYRTSAIKKSTEQNMMMIPSYAVPVPKSN